MQDFLHLFERIAALQMRFRKSLKEIFLRLYKDRQVIFIDLFLHIIVVFPDKAAIFPVFRYDGITHDFLIFIDCIEIKNKNAVRIQIIINKLECLEKIFLFQQIIHTVADADHGSDRSVKLKAAHILL